MAIGDGISMQMGTATTQRVPAAGVEEKITAILKEGTTDVLNSEDAGVTVAIIAAGVVTTTDPVGWNNCALMFDENANVRKEGTTDRVVICGVQTNA